MKGKKIIQEMFVGIRCKKIVSENITHLQKKNIKVINNPCESKRGFTELRRELCVLFGMKWSEL